MSTSPQFEWQTTESEEEWARLAAAPATPDAPARRLSWGMIVLILAVLVSAGGQWYLARVQAQQREAERQTTAGRDLQVQERIDPDAEVAADQESLWHMLEPNGVAMDAPEHEAYAYYASHDGELRMFDLRGDHAIVYVTTPTHRQTLFYRRTTAGWQAVAPNTALWGPEQRLETASFVFHYREQDGEVIAAVAPQIEAMYSQMRANFGLAPPSPAAEKLAIEVSLSDQARAIPRVAGTPDRIIVASPVLYRAPVALTDAELLAQTLALHLARQVVSEAVAQYGLEGGGEARLLQALYLWQVWDLDLPLAAWREAIVSWRLHDLHPRPQGEEPTFPSRLPYRYDELCARHRLWLASPREVGIPLLCSEMDHTDTYWTRIVRVWSTEVDEMLTPVARRVQGAEGEHYWLDWSGDMVALAVLVEFIVAEYGREQLPVFIQELAHHTSPNTLILQVFGLSVAEFEAGWQAYLAEHYSAPVP